MHFSSIVSLMLNCCVGSIIYYWVNPTSLVILVLSCHQSQVCYGNFPVIWMKCGGSSSVQFTQNGKCRIKWNDFRDLGKGDVSM